MMILYYIKSAFRQLLRFKSHTLFSLGSLVIGLACVFIISAWAIHELSFDRFHHQSDKIFMVTTDIKDSNGSIYHITETPLPLAKEAEMRIPQIETGFHFVYLYGGRPIGTEEAKLNEVGIAVTPEFLEVLNFQLISGMPDDLDEPNSIFLSENLAIKLFAEADPISKELIYRDSVLLVVKGVFKDVPRNSSLQFEYLISYQIESENNDNWWQLSDATFIKIAQNADREEVHLLLKQVWRENLDDEQFDIGIIPITDLRYGAQFEFFNVEHGSRMKLNLFLGVAAIILILTCLNYVNLISAYAIKREHEIWIRKVNGASTRNITNYLIVESVLLSVFAWGLAALLSILCLPFFEQVLGMEITPAYSNISIGFGLVISVIIVGLASGFYPAFKAASNVFVKSKDSGDTGKVVQRRLRNSFVLSQFVLSIALATTSFIIMRQASFMKEFETGYAKQDIVGFNLSDNNDNDLHIIKNWLNANPEVEEYSFAGSSLVNLHPLYTITDWSWEGSQEGENTSFYRLNVDEEYLNVFQIPLTEGRFFSSSGTDQDKVVINEKLANLTGFDNPVGQILRNGKKTYEIIGVVKDFNFQHLSNEIKPFLFMYSNAKKFLFVKIRENAEETVVHIQDQILDLSDIPVNYSYIKDVYQKMYRGEQQIITGILFLTLLSILLSCMGLIGLVTYSTESKTKEIAVKKVFGAETRDLMISLNINLLKLFIAGMFSGSFIAWVVMRKWLENFAFREGIEWWVFFPGASLVLVAAILSVIIQTWRAANKSPALALKNQ